MADSNTFRPSCWSHGYRRWYRFGVSAHGLKEVRVRWTVIIPVVPPPATVIVEGEHTERSITPSQSASLTAPLSIERS
ncbi:hypothetical protein GBK64_03980 [Bifidobacterium longum]|nr:hypothetical protein GBL36_00815 [Bifidobacterium longum]KAB6724239.1 hypothetical protein GBL29_02620 [Bifidobacterium longum]KAB6725300.1 hypothetical protein GBL27_00805 [Bifidobacterium longum]KAB6728487.1 hypothetical protein GBL26_01955 [Bifidobacterium longum]KAB6730594.1 hypothetical protein GBL24_00815 [Bifidobacterium longum]